jgi:hypothetical protein
VPGYFGDRQGQVYIVRAVLDRPAVIEDSTSQRHLANKMALLVDPAGVQCLELRRDLAHRRRSSSERRLARETPVELVDKAAAQSTQQLGRGMGTIGRTIKRR